jgi:hypothetical protein
MKPKFNLERPRRRKRIAIGIFNGIALRYLLQTRFIDRLIENKVEVLVIASEKTAELELLSRRLRFSYEIIPDHLCSDYCQCKWPNLQWYAKHVRLHVYGAPNTTGEIFWARYWNDVNAKIREGSFKEKLEYRLRRWLVGQTVDLLKKIKSLRGLFLKVEVYLFTPNIYQDTLKAFDADEVVVTSLGNFDWDQYLVRDAAHLGITSTSIILSWDNTTVRGYGGCRPTRVVVWTRTMKKELVDLHDFSDHEIFVGGVPIFDHYCKSVSGGTAIVDKMVSPEKKLIFFATKSPNAFPWNPNIVRAICEAIRKNLLPDCTLLARIHPLHYRRTDGEFIFGKVLDAYEKLKSEYSVELVVDAPCIEESSLNYVMPAVEIGKLSQILRRSVAVVNMFSTLNIEAAIFDKPLVNVCFEGDSTEYSVNDKARFNIMSDMAETHNRRIADTGGLDLVYNQTQLVEAIQLAIAQPSIRSLGRKCIVEEEAGPYKGTAGSVIADYVSCC